MTKHDAEESETGSVTDLLNLELETTLENDCGSAFALPRSKKDAEQFNKQNLTSAVSYKFYALILSIYFSKMSNNHSTHKRRVSLVPPGTRSRRQSGNNGGLGSRRSSIISISGGVLPRKSSCNHLPEVRHSNINRRQSCPI